MIFYIVDRIFAEVKDGCGEDGIRLTRVEDFCQVRKLASTAASDDRNRDSLADGAGEVDIVAFLSAIGIHAREQNFASAEFDSLANPIDGGEFCGVASSVGIDAPTAGRVAFGIDGEDDALGAESVCGIGDERGVVDGSGIDAHFIGSGEEHGTEVLGGADATADGEGHEALGGGLGDDFHHGRAVVARGGDVKENEFVGPLAVVLPGAFYGVAGIDEVEEADPFDDTAVGDIEARDDPFSEHEMMRKRERRFRFLRKPRGRNQRGDSRCCENGEGKVLGFGEIGDFHEEHSGVEREEKNEGSDDSKGVSTHADGIGAIFFLFWVGRRVDEIGGAHGF